MRHNKLLSRYPRVPEKKKKGTAHGTSRMQYKHTTLRRSTRQICCLCCAVLAMAREALVPSRLQQGCTLLLAATLVAIGVAGGQWFMEADYVVFGYSVSVQ